MGKVLKKAKRMKEIPLWAVLERKLFEVLDQCPDEMIERYVYPNGYMKWPNNPDFQSVDGLDDMYESFHNWPLYYLMGGSKRYLEIAEKEYDAITEQFTHCDTGHGHPMVVKEYEQGYDWMHQGEGYALFYFLNLADPLNPVNKNRSLRYAGFYLNEDPDIQNYDPENRMLLSPHLGSMGPAYRNFQEQSWPMADWKQWYGLPFADLSGIRTLEDIKDNPENARRMGEEIARRFARSDVTVNLLSTSMVMNAYLHTGDEKYREWILNYTGAWRERTAQNGGVIPDNVGPGGVIGGLMPDHKWYGGNYGWTWPHGFYFLADALTVATEHELLLTGDRDKTDWIRSQYTLLREKGKKVSDTWFLPMKKGDSGAVHEYRPDAPDRVLLMDDSHKVTDNPLYRRYVEDDGWFEFMPLTLEQPAHLWFMSRAKDDYEFIYSLQDFRKTDWADAVLSYSMKKCTGGHDLAWLNFLNGRFPEYPEKIMENNINHAYARMKAAREDEEPMERYNDSYFQYRNPVTVEGLVQLTMGGPLPIYNGGLLQAAVRYFDEEKKRPGLPEDVAALVSDLRDDALTLTLVNLSMMKTRRLCVLGGVYGEHEFVSALIDGESIAIGDSLFSVELEPASALKMELTVSRYHNPPRYRDPFVEE